MAFVLFVFGAVSGIVAMITSIFVFDAGFLSALGVWFGTGMAVSVAGIALAVIPRGEIASGEMATRDLAEA